MTISSISFRPYPWLPPTGAALILVSTALFAPHVLAACPSQDAENKDLVAVKSPEDMDCYLDRKRLDPDNRIWAQESYRMAKQTALWVAKVLSDEGASDPMTIAGQFPVAFAFYPDGRYEYGTCEKNTASKYLKKGGAGEPLCNLMEESSSLGSGSLTDLTVQLMEVGRSQSVNSDNAEAISQAKQKAMNGIFAQVRDLGFDPYYRFTQEYNTNLVYNPKVDKFGNMIPVSPSQTDYAGLSGGGGSGAGFGLYCLKPDNTQLTILEFGGGGGAGATSPGGEATPLEAGGGGNSGMRVRHYTWDRLDTGKYLPTEDQGSPLETFSFSQLNWSFGAIYDDDSVVNWSALPLKMSNAIDSLKKCRDNGWPIQIRGGGGGGEGFEFLKTSGGQDDLLALNLGYGFQFAIGLDANGQPLQLYRHPVPALSQKQVIVCPYTREIGIGIAKETVVDWRKCLSDSPPPTAQQSNSQEPTSLYSCMGNIVPKICKNATYVDSSDGNKTKSYTAYGSYNSCNGPISAWYKEEYGTLWDKIYEPSSKGPPNAPPVITKATFNKVWCSGIKPVTGCGQLKECQ